MLRLLWGVNRCLVVSAKGEKHHPGYRKQKVQKHQFPWQDYFYMCEETIYAETFVGILERHMQPLR